MRRGVPTCGLKLTVSENNAGCFLTLNLKENGRIEHGHDEDVI